MTFTLKKILLATGRRPLAMTGEEADKMCRFMKISELPFRIYLSGVSLFGMYLYGIYYLDYTSPEMRF